MCYRWMLVPRAQVRAAPIPYRDYGNHKTRLLERIIHRVKRQRKYWCPHIHMHQLVSSFLLGWFRGSPSLTSSAAAEKGVPKKQMRPTLPRLQPSSISSSSETSDEEESPDEVTTISGLKKADVESFFAWAFFAKEVVDLTASEQVEMQQLFEMFLEKCNMKFEPGWGGLFESRRLTLEDVHPLHRPLLVYVVIRFMELMGNLMLRLNGFRCYCSKSGLVYWHRPGVNRKTRPFLFFHGIVPGGKTLYIPFCLWGIGDRNRSMFLFENKSIGGSISFEALTEDETVSGVEEALAFHGDEKRALTLCGHSFGSCPLTWLLHSSCRSRISQVILMDPVTILLSEPDVMFNFLYARHETTAKFDKVQLFAGSELFTEYYLRRHFAWYNSELWMDSLPDSTQLLVCLSEKDTIVAASRVKLEIESHSLSNVDVVFWKGAEHADCISTPELWRQVREGMLAQNDNLSNLKKQD